ncbi:MAG: efflux RND transporter periplasmic adaptor subunit [Bacteroidota bacterium]|nr:efflux RND transporter periplasmic adaptor subunit [Bacteroidota bacterium]MDX5430813.1 efflux RND transporter periplasmic adaptor subunit [Bacteroidota bacterium]MDX5469559.1 efflux RND transporter periplasmic adaptor subunit [Bacteroidota bacterium]
MAKNKNRVWLWIMGALLLVLVILAIFMNRGKDKIYVTTEASEVRDITEMVTANGTIQPEVEVKISSEVSGEIIALYIKEGDSVKKGDLLLQVNPDISESNVERARASVNNAKANLAAARARVEQAKARFALAKTTFERSKKLFADKVIAPQEFEQSQSEFRTAEGELEAAQRAVDAAEYTVKSLESTLSGEQKNLNRTSIFAPMDGIVSKLNVEKGERVVGTMQMTGTELLRIADFSTMELRVDVGESDIIRVNKGDTAEIEVDAYDDRTFIGIVTEVANSSKTGLTTSSDQVTNFEVKISILPSSYNDLLAELRGKPSPFLPGMSGMADIRTKSAVNVISVPIEAVTLRKIDTKEKADSTIGETDGEEKEDEKREVVFLLQDGKAVMKPVVIGVQDSRYIEIKEGLEEKSEVISGPYSVVSRTLEDGQAVEIKKKSEFYKRKKD